MFSPDIYYEFTKHFDYETYVSFVRCSKAHLKLFQTPRFHKQFIRIQRHKLLSLCKNNSKNAFYKVCHINNVELLEHMFMMGDANQCNANRCIRIACYHNKPLALQMLLDKFLLWRYGMLKGEPGFLHRQYTRGGTLRPFRQCPGTIPQWTFSTAFVKQHLDCVKVIITNEACRTSDFIRYFLFTTIYDDASETLNCMLKEEQIKSIVEPHLDLCILKALQCESLKCYKVLLKNCGINTVPATLSFFVIRWFKYNPAMLSKVKGIFGFIIDSLIGLMFILAFGFILFWSN